MLRAGDELIVGTGLEAEKRTDVRSKNLCKSKNNIQYCNVSGEIIVIFLECHPQCSSQSREKLFEISI